MEIIVDAKKPFLNIAKFTISKINFLSYVECFQERITAARRTSDETQANIAFARARRLKQIKAFTKDNAEVNLNHVIFSQMPRNLFVQLNKAIDMEGDPSGEVIANDGDGLYTPILYKLGTPLPFQDSAIGNKPIGTESKIIELEFIAKTGGDIEEVLCAENNLDQTIALLKSCATPIGGETSLIRLPSWMLNSLTVQDGMDILLKVLPTFLE